MKRTSCRISYQSRKPTIVQNARLRHDRATRHYQRQQLPIRSVPTSVLILLVGTMAMWAKVGLGGVAIGMRRWVVARTVNGSGTKHRHRITITQTRIVVR